MIAIPNKEGNMGNEVNNIINNLCEKLGTTVTNLTPEMARMNIAEDMVAIVITALFAIGIAIFWRWANSGKHDFDEDWLAVVMFILLLICAVGVALCAFDFIPDLVKWAVAPKARMAEYILKAIG